MIYETIVGDIADLTDPKQIYFYDCPNIVGSIDVIRGAEEIVLVGTGVSGVIHPDSTCTKWNLNRTLLTKTDIEDCLDNLVLLKDAGYNDTDILGFDGYYICEQDMPYIDNTYQLVVDDLEDAGWVIQVNIEDGAY
jgi:hypothetical protein